MLSSEYLYEALEVGTVILIFSIIIALAWMSTYVPNNVVYRDNFFSRPTLLVWEQPSGGIDTSNIATENFIPRDELLGFASSNLLSNNLNTNMQTSPTTSTNDTQSSTSQERPQSNEENSNVRCRSKSPESTENNQETTNSPETEETSKDIIKIRLKFVDDRQKLVKGKLTDILGQFKRYGFILVIWFILKLTLVFVVGHIFKFNCRLIVLSD